MPHHVKLSKLGELGGFITEEFLFDIYGGGNVASRCCNAAPVGHAFIEYQFHFISAKSAYKYTAKMAVLQNALQGFGEHTDLLFGSLFGYANEDAVFHIGIIPAQREAGGETLFDKLAYHIRGIFWQVEHKFVEEPPCLEMGFYARYGGEAIIGVAGLVGTKLRSFAQALFA